MDAGAEERLIGVDVAQPRQNSLIEQERLNPRPPVREPGCQSFGIKVRR